MTSNLQKLTKSLQNYADNRSYNSVILSVNTYEELTTNEALQAYISEGIKCFVKYEKCYYKYTGGTWKKDIVYEYSDEEPADINVIWFPKTTPVASTPQEEVTLDSLIQTVQALVTKNELLEARVKYLEENGVKPPDSGGGDADTDTITTAIMIDANTPLMIDDNTILLFNQNTSTPIEEKITNALMVDNSNPLKINNDEIFLIK